MTEELSKDTREKIVDPLWSFHLVFSAVNVISGVCEYYSMIKMIIVQSNSVNPVKVMHETEFWSFW